MITDCSFRMTPKVVFIPVGLSVWYLVGDCKFLFHSREHQYVEWNRYA